MSLMQIVITNLHLLFFPDIASITPTTFSAIADHKLTDILFHFLLSKVNPTKAHKLFRMTLPPEDFSSRREFRTLVYQWLEEIKPHFIGSAVLRKSLIDEGRGERFQELLFALSTYTLHVVLKRNYPETALPEMAELKQMSSKELDALIQQRQTQYLECVQSHYGRQLTWREYSETLTREHERIDADLAEIDAQRRKRRRSSASFRSFQQQWVETSVQCAHAWQTLAAHPWDRVPLASALSNERRVLRGPQATHPVDWTRVAQLAELSVRPLVETSVEPMRAHVQTLVDRQNAALRRLEGETERITRQLEALPILKYAADYTIDLAFPLVDLAPAPDLPLQLAPYGAEADAASPLGKHTPSVSPHAIRPVRTTTPVSQPTAVPSRIPLAVRPTSNLIQPTSLPPHPDRPARSSLFSPPVAVTPDSEPLPRFSLVPSPVAVSPYFSRPVRTTPISQPAPISLFSTPHPPDPRHTPSSSLHRAVVSPHTPLATPSPRPGVSPYRVPPPPPLHRTLATPSPFRTPLRTAPRLSLDTPKIPFSDDLSEWDWSDAEVLREVQFNSKSPRTV